MFSPCSLWGPPSFPAATCKQTHLVPNWPGLRLKAFLAGPIFRRSLLKSKLLQAPENPVSELTTSSTLLWTHWLATSSQLLALPVVISLKHQGCYVP